MSQEIRTTFEHSSPLHSEKSNPSPALRSTAFTFYIYIYYCRKYNSANFCLYIYIYKQINKKVEVEVSSGEEKTNIYKYKGIYIWIFSRNFHLGPTNYRYLPDKRLDKSQNKFCLRHLYKRKHPIFSQNLYKK